MWEALILSEIYQKSPFGLIPIQFDVIFWLIFQFCFPRMDTQEQSYFNSLSRNQTTDEDFMSQEDEVDDDEEITPAELIEKLQQVSQLER